MKLWCREYAIAGADISADGKHRYTLWRTWDNGMPPLTFCMLNPSTADATKDDPTIRRCVGFAQREGRGGIYVVNLSSYRASSPKELRKAYAAGEEVMPEINNEHLISIVGRHESMVLAWGASIFPWMQPLASLLRAYPGVRCFGVTKRGEPHHPLMVPSTQPLVTVPSVLDNLIGE